MITGGASAGNSDGPPLQPQLPLHSPKSLTITHPQPHMHTHHLEPIMSIPTTQTVAWIEDPGPSGRLTIRSDKPVQEPSHNEVLVKLQHSGICHSDCHNVLGRGKYREIPGHEGVGQVVKLGPGANEGLMGKRVGIKWLYSSCKECSACKRGNINNCAKQSNTGRTTLGTLQQYVVAHADFVTMIPDGVKSEVAAPLLCAGLSLAGAVSKLQPEVQPGEFVVVVGAGGGLGHVGVQIATIKGYKVIAIDSGAEKEQLAKEMGAAHFIDFAKQDVIQAVKDLTDGEGAHGLICVAGSERAYEQATELIRSNGVFVCVGLPPSDYMFPMSPIHIANRGLVIRGSSTGTAAQMDELLQLAKEGKITPKIEVFDFEDSPKIIEELNKYEVTGRKVVRAPV